MMSDRKKSSTEQIGERGGVGEYQEMVGMKKGWITKKLEDVCEIERGGSPRPIQNFITTDSNGINWIKISDATASDKYIYSTEQKIKPEGASRSRMVYVDDFILSNSMSFGRPYIMKTTGCIHDGWLVLRQREKQVEQDFLYYVLSSDLVFQQFDQLAAGSTVRNLNIGLVKGVTIPFPPLAEQRRIVGVLDEAFAGLATAQANAQKNLQNARALFESHLQSVFSQRGDGWVEKRLGDVADFKNGLNFTRQSKGQTLRMVGVGDFQDHEVVPSAVLQSVTIDGDLSKEYLIRGDDILTVRSNGSKDLVGRCMLVPEVEGMISYSGFIIRIRFDTREICPRFLLRFMKSSETRAQLTRDGGGANISNINQAKLSALPISLPSFREQEKIATQLDALAAETQRLETHYTRKLAALAELKKSLLHQAFSGEL
jgi:type I restriction enzyme S subunit